MTQEDGSIHTALAWLSASITALQKGDSEREGRVGGGGIHFFLNPASPADPKIRRHADLREAAGCDMLFSASSP